MSTRLPTLNEIELETLMTVATFQPMEKAVLLGALEGPASEAESSIAKLLKYDLIAERSGKLVLTVKGHKGVGRSGLRKVRDVSRLLYLWRAQQRGEAVN
ncbi:MAG: hypothetical protein AB7N24_13020 [Dehalococcoidia bacterium]